MAGIAGIKKAGEFDLVKRMLDRISHRGNSGTYIFEKDGVTVGAIWPSAQKYSVTDSTSLFVQDSAGGGHCVKASLSNGKLRLERDELGLAPLYFGKTKNNQICFASEVKSLLVATDDINELQPGSYLFDEKSEKYFHLEKQEKTNDDPTVISKTLRKLLEESISSRIKNDSFGSWLSGGLDSSTIAAIARPFIKKLHTFSAGLKNSPDLEFAKEVAYHINSDHHEIIVDFNDMIKNLPEVIYHLESFDALLVRSSIINYIAAKAASDYVGEIFSGEGGDELFAGYIYLKALSPESIDSELIDITCRLHNTAFQRVDRCASAHSTIPHVVFADPNVFNYALTIPTEYKLKDGIEKWILRESVNDILPLNVLKRTKAKFWEGAGVNELMSDYASLKISDGDFAKERNLPNGWILNSKEELFYYRIFKEYFGSAFNFDWMGRTKKTV